jgi:hypothetical protein
MGDKGLSGTTQTVYTGTVSADTDNVNNLAAFDVSAPALTANSSVSVYIASTSTTWQDWGFRSIDLSSKTIQMEVGYYGSPNHFQGKEYKAIVQNPS